ncbi:GNAT family N-acetyltransferase [Paenibacillus campinasensis]|uniref:GNAT family N-acetyltransferase n=3 Tax=Paenibacillus campinasensis TaxID=66347 RepID=A0A268EZ36_9BACL|nr:GNAT family N-acetyltransferase [Paenibacillus campinasensis]
MTEYRFHPMTEEYAAEISTWKYPEPYSLYSMEHSDEDIAELMNGDYFYALDMQNALAGFICKGNSARVPGGVQAGLYDDADVMDMGLGLRPDVTGRGKGRDFLLEGIAFLKERFEPKRLQLVVALFNKRAIAVYERSGFVKGKKFSSKVGERDMEFVAMHFTGGITDDNT